MQNQTGHIQQQKSDCEEPTYLAAPLNKRNAKDIHKMIQKLKDNQDSTEQI